MSIFGWTVTHTTAGDAPPRSIYDPIHGCRKEVPTVTTTAERRSFAVDGRMKANGDFSPRKPQPPPPRGSQPQTCHVLGSSVTAVAPSYPRVVPAVTREACVDAFPSVHLELSHAYNRRVFSRGSMKYPYKSLVAQHADRTSVHPGRAKQAGGGLGLITPRAPLVGDAAARPAERPYVPPIAVDGDVVAGLRFLRKEEVPCASDALLIASARSTDDSRCAAHAARIVSARQHWKPPPTPTEAAEQEYRRQLRVTRPLTARRVLQDVTTAIVKASSRPSTARTSRPSTARAGRPGDATALADTMMPLSGESIKGPTVAQETHDAIARFETRLRDAELRRDNTPWYAVTTSVETPALVDGG